MQRAGKELYATPFTCMAHTRLSINTCSVSVLFLPSACTALDHSLHPSKSLSTFFRTCLLCEDVEETGRRAVVGQAMGLLRQKTPGKFWWPGNMAESGFLIFVNWVKSLGTQPGLLTPFWLWGRKLDLEFVFIRILKILSHLNQRRSGKQPYTHLWRCTCVTLGRGWHFVFLDSVISAAELEECSQSPISCWRGNTHIFHGMLLPWLFQTAHLQHF